MTQVLSLPRHSTTNTLLLISPYRHLPLTLPSYNALPPQTAPMLPMTLNPTTTLHISIINRTLTKWTSAQDVYRHLLTNQNPRKEILQEIDRARTRTLGAAVLNHDLLEIPIILLPSNDDEAFCKLLTKRLHA